MKDQGLQVWRSWPIRAPLMLLAIWCFATAWNAGKAFHIDDTAHLEIARWIAANPWHPMSGPLHWLRDVEPIHRTNQPHLFFYLMAVWAWLFGWSEAAMHTLLAAFTGWAIFGFHRVASWLRPDAALTATALFALGPAFVTGQNIMVDVPLVAVWLAFFGALLNPAASVQRRYLQAACWSAAALLIKYNSLVLLPALALFAILERRPRQAAWVLLPMAVLGLWSLFNLADYGGIHIAGRKSEPRQWAEAWEMAVGWVVAVGAAGAFTPWMLGPWLRRGQPTVGRWFVWILVGLCLLGPAVMLVGTAATVTELWAYRLTKLSFLSVGGGLALVLLARGAQLARQRALRPRDGLLLYWLLSTAVFTVWLAPFMAMRHVLLALPPLLLLFLLWQPVVVPRAATYVAVALSLVLTTVLAAADRLHADVYRHYAFSIRAGLPADANVWFNGHWGWQWYAAQAGMQQFSFMRDRPGVGDFVVTPVFVTPSLGPPPETLEGFETIVVPRDGGFEAFVDKWVGLYWSSAWQMPWGRFTGPLEVFQIERVITLRDEATLIQPAGLTTRNGAPGR